MSFTEDLVKQLEEYLAGVDIEIKEKLDYLVAREAERNEALSAIAKLKGPDYPIKSILPVQLGSIVMQETPEQIEVSPDAKNVTPIRRRRSKSNKNRLWFRLSDYQIAKYCTRRHHSNRVENCIECDHEVMVGERYLRVKGAKKGVADLIKEGVYCLNHLPIPSEMVKASA